MKNIENNNLLNSHPAYGKLFQPNKLSFGLVAPLKGYPNSPFPNMDGHKKLVQKADNIGLGAIWLRDVPFYDPGFGDAGQLYDPMVYAGWLAAETQQIAIGTAGVVLPLRNPILLAKQALSLDHLTEGRFLLGVAGGDRPLEYPAFGIDYEKRKIRFREAVELMKTLIGTSFPKFRGENYGELNGQLDLVPKLKSEALPIINIGRAGQNISWIADNTDGWIWHGSQAREVPEIMKMWRRHTEGRFIPYGYGHLFDLSENPDEPVELSGNSIRGGRNTLIKFWQSQRRQGLSHVILNLKFTRRNAIEILDEFGEFILPAFE